MNTTHIYIFTITFSQSKTATPRGPLLLTNSDKPFFYGQGGSEVELLLSKEFD